MARVLVVEDQKKHLDSLRRGLEAEGYDVATASTGEEGLALATSQEVDAIVLDLMLPGRDGMGILRELRSRGFAKPILILTARDSVEDRVEAWMKGRMTTWSSHLPSRNFSPGSARSCVASCRAGPSFCELATSRWTFSVDA